MEIILRRLPDNPWINNVVSFFMNRYLRTRDRLILTKARRKSSYSLSFQSSPRVFVYIPSYNRVDYLVERSIPSVLSQTYNNISLLVVDDGSTDQTPEILNSKFGEKVNVLTINRNQYRYPNKSLYHWFAGPVEAANAALSNCSGDWIARIDDDDEWLPDHLERNIQFALENKYEFVSSKYKTIDKDGKEKIISADKNNNIGGTQTWIYHSGFSMFKYNIHCWRKKWNKVNDTDLQDRFYQAGVRIGFLDNVGCIIRPRKDESFIGSQAYVQSEKKYEDFYK